MIEYNRSKTVTEDEFHLADKLIRVISWRYANYGISRQDLIQAGWQGYLQGKRDFDEFNGCPYEIWVFQNIMWEMCNLLTKEFKQRNILKSHPFIEELQERYSEDNANKVVDRISVEQAISVLSEQQRKFLDLRFNFGLTEAQTATKLGISQGLVSSLERQVLAILKSELQPPGEKRRDLIPTLKGGKIKNES